MIGRVAAASGPSTGSADAAVDRAPEIPIVHLNHNLVSREIGSAESDFGRVITFGAISLSIRRKVAHRSLVGAPRQIG